ncbi:MAG: glycosyltransferase family 2 protein [Chloroflexota bacterium]
MKPLVSIVTPSYNQAQFLENTIQSVLAQDYPKPLIEYLIVDGGSQDGSLEIIQRYAGALSWWVSEPDSGQAEAINKGLRKAHGEIVAWLNSDDLYLPGAVTRAVSALQANPGLGMVFGDAITIDTQGQLLNQLQFGNWELADLMNFRIICQPAVFMRRAVLEKAGYLDQSYHYMLDHHLWVRIARLAPIGHIDYLPLHSVDSPTELVPRGLPLAAARHHPGAKNVAQPVKFGQETMRLLAWMQSQSIGGTERERSRRSATDRHMLGGAYRLNARYLLDGGLAGPALQSYLRALSLWPGYAIKHWHRMFYALFVLLKINRNFLFRTLTDRFRISAAARQRSQLAVRLKAAFSSAERPNEFGPVPPEGRSADHPSSITNWPGLRLD